MPRTDVEELKDIFREHGDANSLAMRDVPANTELKQVTACISTGMDSSIPHYAGFPVLPSIFLPAVCVSF